MANVIFTFGRFQGPTKGHERLVSKIQEIALEEGAEMRLYASHSMDSERNPLPYNDKIVFLEWAFGDMVHYSDARTIADVVQDLVEQGFDSLTMVVGDDRVEDYTRIMGVFAEEFGITANVVSAGERDTTEESASYLRQMVAEGNFDAFAEATPSTLNIEDTEALYDALSEAMGLSEVLNVRQRKDVALDTKRRKNTMKMAKKRALAKTAGGGVINNRARRMARNLIKKRMAGGKDYKNLSTAQKMAIDQRFKKKKKLVDRLAKRLAPKLRQIDTKRRK